MRQESASGSWLKTVESLSKKQATEGDLGIGDRGLGIGDRGLGIWAQGIRNSEHRIPNPESLTAVKAADLVDTLQGPGPFTVFAPTNAAFAKLPSGTVETLLQPESKAMLTKVLTYHVVSGRLSSDELKKQIKKGDGTTWLKTVSGGTLWAMMDGNDILLKDEKGDVSRITQANVFQSNGVIHVIDTVVLPK